MPLAGLIAGVAALSVACASTVTPRPRTPATMGARPAEAPETETAESPAAEPAPSPADAGGEPSSAAEAVPPTTTEAVPAPPAPRASKSARAIVETALSLRGVRYQPGGADTRGFDCSGFTMYVFARHGVDLPRSAAEQAHEGKSIKRRDIRAGDLLFFKTIGKEVTHVGISIDGDRFIHAPNSTGVVRVESLETTYWSSRFTGARRVK